MNVYKIRHIPSQRWSMGKYWEAVNLNSPQEPVGKIWNYYKDAKGFLANLTPDQYPQDFEIVTFTLVETGKEPNGI